MSPIPSTWPATVRRCEDGNAEWVAELRFSSAELVADTDHGTVAIPLRRIQIDRLRDGRLMFSDPEDDDCLVLTSAVSVLDHPSFHRQPHLFRRLRQLESTAQARRAVLATLAFLAVFALALGALALLSPYAVRLAASRIPYKTETDLGAQLTDRITKVHPVLDDRVLAHRLAAVTNRLSEAIRLASPTCMIAVIDSSQVNAIALPGGQILVCRGLLEQVTDGEELAGVIAHELAHVQYRHGLQSLVGATGPFLLARLAFGDGQSQVGSMVEQSQQLLALRFSREQEHEADAAAFRMLVEARIDPRGLVRFMRRMDAEERAQRSAAADGNSRPVPDRIERVARTHPLTPDRLRHLEALWKTLPRTARWEPVPWLLIDPRVVRTAN